MEATINSSFHLPPKKPPFLSPTIKNVRISKTIIASSSSSSSEKSSGEGTIELRVCTNRSCNRQGSRSVLEVLSAIAPPSVSVAGCGCLGRCGAGPNLLLLPDGPTIGHCGTAARAARILAELCGPRFDPQRSLEALALRNEAEEEIEKGNFSHAQLLLSRAIELRPSGGLQFMYKFRSAARLGMGDCEGALKDAEEACRIAPKFPQAFICQGDAFMEMEQYDSAEKAYSNALLIDPSIRRSRSFKARLAKLEKRLIASNASS